MNISIDNDNNALVVKWCTAKQVDLHPPSVIAGLQIHKIHPHTTKLELCMYISVSQNIHRFPAFYYIILQIT